MVRSESLRLAELAGPLALAVTQPLLGPFGESPTTFIAVGASTATIIGFALVVALGPLLVAAALGLASRVAGQRARRLTHLVLLGLASGGAAVVIARAVDAGVAVRLVAGLAAAGGVPAAYLAWTPVRTFLRFAAVAPAVLVMAFLFLSPVSGLLDRGGGSAGASGGDGELADVVILVLDELPTLSLMDGEGGIDAARFPNLADLAETSTWYRNATTVSPNTSVAVPALLSGVFEDTRHDRASTYSEYPDNLFSLLADTHHLNVQEWTTDLCPPGACAGAGPEWIRDEDVAELISEFDAGSGTGAMSRLLEEAGRVLVSTLWPFGEPDDPAYTVLGTQDAADVAEPGLVFLGSLLEGPDDVPRVDYLHAPLPHQPWFLLPSGAYYETPHPPLGVEVSQDRPGDFMAWVEPGEPDHGEVWAEASRARHLLQLQWTDRLVGAVMERLIEEDRWDETVFVVTSDHGVAFEAGESLRTPSPANELEIGWVPLLIKAPGQDEGEVSDENVLLVDVLPTVAALSGLEPAWETDGEVLSGRIDREDDYKPLVVPEPQRFEQRGPGDTVFMDPRGFLELLEAPGVGENDDSLAVWRHGRHGEVLGEALTTLGVCDEPFEVALEAQPDWEGELWVDASFESSVEADVVIAVDGTVAGWSPTIAGNQGARVGVLLAEPLADESGALSYFAVTGGQDCRLSEVIVRSDG